ncbi:hypothetical protein HQ563_02985 [bacterium]|nr:hypothetical protein [bacterium]
MKDKPKRTKTGQFAPGTTGNPAGRPKGALNHYSRLKDAVMEAFEGAGGTEYLQRIADDDPRTFLALLGRLLPRGFADSVSMDSVHELLASVEQAVKRSVQDPEEREVVLLEVKVLADAVSASSGTGGVSEVRHVIEFVEAKVPAEDTGGDNGGDRRF